MASKVKTAASKRKSARPTVVQHSDEPVTQLATRVPSKTYKELKLYAVTNSVSIADLVSESIADLLHKKGWKFQKAS